MILEFYYNDYDYSKIKFWREDPVSLIFDCKWTNGLFFFTFPALYADLVDFGHAKSASTNGLVTLSVDEIV